MQSRFEIQNSRIENRYNATQSTIEIRAGRPAGRVITSDSDHEEFRGPDAPHRWCNRRTQLERSTEVESRMGLQSMAIIRA